MSVKLLTHLRFLILNGGCTGPSESTFVKIPHCWKSHIAAHIILNFVPAVQELMSTMFFTLIVILFSGVEPLVQFW